MDGMTYVVCKRDGRNVCGILQSPPDAPHPPSWLAYVYVADVDHASREIERLGGTIVSPARDIPGIGRFAVFRDPTGATLALFTP